MGHENQNAVKTIKRLLKIPHESLEEAIEEILLGLNTPQLLLMNKDGKEITVPNRLFDKMPAIKKNLDLDFVVKGKLARPGMHQKLNKLYIHSYGNKGKMSEHQLVLQNFQVYRDMFIFSYVRLALGHKFFYESIAGIYVHGRLFEISIRELYHS